MLSDGLSTAQSTVTVAIAENQSPVIVSIDNRDTSGRDSVTSLVLPNTLTVTFPAEVTDDFPPGILSWKITDASSGSTVRFVVVGG